MKAEDVSVVFVVDDEIAISKSLALILQKQGFFTHFFTDPLAALEHIKPILRICLISDVSILQLSGIELAIEVKAHHPTCKILLFSGQATTADLLETARKDGHDFPLLEKPVHPSVLLQEIQRL